MNQDPKLPGRYRHSASIQLAVGAGDAWTVIADFSAVDTWAPQVTNSYQIGTLDRGVGAQRHCDIQGFGSIRERVTDWQEGRSLTYDVSPLGPIARSVNRWTVTPVGDRACRVTTELAFDTRFGLVGRMMYHAMMRRALTKALPKGLQALKRRVETGTTVRPRRAPEGRPQLVAA